jgi:hypothetical protein
MDGSGGIEFGEIFILQEFFILSLGISEIGKIGDKFIFTGLSLKYL